MIRFLNVLVVALLVAAAGGVYSIKYESTLAAEKVAKLRRAIEKERVALSTLKAEWAALARPDRIDELARKHLSLQPMKLDQIDMLANIPQKTGGDDLIAKKLEGLGLADDPPATGSTP